MCKGPEEAVLGEFEAQRAWSRANRGRMLGVKSKQGPSLAGRVGHGREFGLSKMRAARGFQAKERQDLPCLFSLCTLYRWPDEGSALPGSCLPSLLAELQKPVKVRDLGAVPVGSGKKGLSESCLL